MKLTRVTITGADDAVAPSDLHALADEFPFVEWALLISGSRQGTPRYPSADWLYDIERASCGAVRGGQTFVADGWNLAAHLCGQDARAVFDGNDDFFSNPHPYRRVQLNGFSQAKNLDGVLEVIAENPSVEFICQIQSSEAFKRAARLAELVFNITPLWDVSGGRGQDPERWRCPNTGARWGYAGGFGPHNVQARLEMLTAFAVDAEFWIDMESHVRTDDRFDLAKVRAVLELARPFVEGSAG